MTFPLCVFGRRTSSTQFFDLETYKIIHCPDFGEIWPPIGVLGYASFKKEAGVYHLVQFFKLNKT